MGMEGAGVATDEGLLDSLQKRKQAIEEGAGRRYRCVTLVGFLNIHSSPGDPHRLDNVLGQLREGAVVESVQEEGAWVCHDAGGWSIREYDGHAFLVPID